MPTRWIASLALAVLLACQPWTTRAHPHAWVDVRSTVQFGADGRIQAIVQEWLFDEFYTAFATEGWSASKLDAKVQELARENIGNLRPYDYFTMVRADGERVEIGVVTEFDSSIRDGRLNLKITVPLRQPVDPRERQVTFAIYDPTYYIEFLYVKGALILFRGAKAQGCFAQIEQPSPSAEAVMLASRLDVTEQAPGTLGAQFAETAVVACK